MMCGGICVVKLGLAGGGGEGMYGGLEIGWGLVGGGRAQMRWGVA